MNIAHQLPPQPPLEPYKEFEPFDNDVSGVHRRYAPGCRFVSQNHDDPTVVYVVFDGSEEYHFVGVRFATGIIVAEGWASTLWRAGIPLESIDAAAAWLREHAL